MSNRSGRMKKVGEKKISKKEQCPLKSGARGGKCLVPFDQGSGEWTWNTWDQGTKKIGAQGLIKNQPIQPKK